MSFPFTNLLLLMFLTSSSFFITPAHSKMGRLGISPNILKNAPKKTTQKNDESDIKFFYFNQTLDHFTFTPKSYMTFQQRYAIDAKHWAGVKVNAPILAFLGLEASLETDLAAFGFLSDNAPHFKALKVYIEVCVSIYSCAVLSICCSVCM